MLDDFHLRVACGDQVGERFCNDAGATLAVNQRKVARSGGCNEDT